MRSARLGAGYTQGSMRGKVMTYATVRTKLVAPIGEVVPSSVNLLRTPESGLRKGYFQYLRRRLRPVDIHEERNAPGKAILIHGFQNGGSHGSFDSDG